MLFVGLTVIASLFARAFEALGLRARAPRRSEQPAAEAPHFIAEQRSRHEGADDMLDYAIGLQARTSSPTNDRTTP